MFDWSVQRTLGLPEKCIPMNQGIWVFQTQKQKFETVLKKVVFFILLSWDPLEGPDLEVGNPCSKCM